MSASFKNEIGPHEDSSFTTPTSLKNEIGYEHGSFTVSRSLKNEMNPLPI